MPIQQKLSFWRYAWFWLKWWFFCFPTVGIYLTLSLSEYPVLAVLPAVIYIVLFVRDAARLSGATRGKHVRSDGGEAPRTLRNTILLWLLAMALGCLVFYYGPYLFLALLALCIVFALLRPFARRCGWFDEGRVTAPMKRPRFVDDRFRGSVDPTR